MEKKFRMFSEFDKHNPTRSPAWRCERAEELIKTGRRPSREPQAHISARFNESTQSQTKAMATISLAGFNSLDALKLLRSNLNISTTEQNAEACAADVERNIDAFFKQLPKGVAEAVEQFRPQEKEHPPNEH